MLILGHLTLFNPALSEASWLRPCSSKYNPGGENNTVMHWPLAMLQELASMQPTFQTARM